MGLKICSLSSGSTGNCIYVASDTTKILIDSGIPLMRVEKSLRVLKNSCSDLNVIVTHTHHDHVSGIPALCEKYGASVYAHFLSCSLKNKLKSGSKKFCEFGDGDFYIGDLMISPFRVSHDVPTVGFSICGGNKKISVLTDLGFLSPAVLSSISDSDIVLLESNHDETLVRGNAKYTPALKKRILSDCGHLSNTDCAKATVALAKNGVRQIILAHLSKENNYPELAFNTVSGELLENGIKEGTDISIEVAPALGMSGLFEVC